TAIEELQSTNEELETTNEELQSTNEELETTNEELQSTNEELETSVEELQVANAELGTLNAELEARSSELKRLDAYHLGLLNSMEQSVFVTDRALVVTSWNQAAERMWGLRAGEATGRDVMALPLGDATRILRTSLETVSKRGVPVEVRDVPYTLPGGEVRTAVVKLAPLHDGGGELIGVIRIAAPGETPAAGGARRCWSCRAAGGRGGGGRRRRRACAEPGARASVPPRAEPTPPRGAAAAGPRTSRRGRALRCAP